MLKNSAEWIKQADYDIETADILFNTGRYFYAIFMCHLSIEKSLKGIFLLKRNEIPTKTHNLIYLLNKIGLKPPESIGKFIVNLNEASINTRYPDMIS